jgi:hypothetical protein
MPALRVTTVSRASGGAGCSERVCARAAERLVRERLVCTFRLFIGTNYTRNGWTNKQEVGYVIVV